MWSGRGLLRLRWKPRRCGIISPPGDRSFLVHHLPEESATFRDDALGSEHPKRVLDLLDLPLGSLGAQFDRLAGTVKIEEPDATELRPDTDVGWIAGKPRAGDAVLGDIDRVHHHRRHARCAVGPAKNLPV